MDDFAISESAWQAAAEYARLPYQTVVVPDETSSGTCFVARNPELPGCAAHGETTDEAEHSLAEARQLYIASLIEDGETVPLPAKPVAGQWIVTRVSVRRPGWRGITVAVRPGSRLAGQRSVRTGPAWIVRDLAVTV